MTGAVKRFTGLLPNLYSEKPPAARTKNPSLETDENSVMERAKEEGILKKIMDAFIDGEHINV